ncbi:uncharacterized protein LOC101854335 [Aplysia californica]|uniref:Uncharacterized protein LOC101854335 n=1 Tax=Aplysia californica TaxID=6500 RepID=A0ABM0JRZ4_APLCA|nr:uncharacterized protein LOC101854335 [Aplysia californica]
MKSCLCLLGMIFFVALASAESTDKRNAETCKTECSENADCGKYETCMKLGCSKICFPIIVRRQAASRPCLKTPMCRIYCATGYVLDSEGCALCECKTPPTL